MNLKKYLVPFTVISVLLLGLGLAVLLTQKEQEIREKAAVPGGVGQLTLTPSTVSLFPGDMVTAQLKFRTGPDPASALAISAVTAKITYPYSGVTPELDVVDQNGNPSNQVFPDPTLAQDPDWSFPVKSVTRSGGLVTIELAAFTTNFAGFTTSTETNLATIYFKVNSVPLVNPITLTFDTTDTTMVTKTDPPQDILDIPVNGSYTIQTDTIPPDPINDLSLVSTNLNSASLSWTSPADQGPLGTASSYDLRYSTSLITDANWPQATQVSGEPTPASPGTIENFTVTGLNSGVSYYFAIRASDADNNISLLSNVVTGSTLASSLNFGFRIQGISQPSISKTIDVTIEQAGTIVQTYSVATTSDASGIFRPNNPIQLVGVPIPQGGVSLDVLVQAPTYLRKLLGTITIAPGVNNAPSSWESQRMLVGDYVAPFNVLTLFDIGDILSVYTALTIPVTPTNSKYDVDLNGVINVFDVSLVITNYTALQVPGD